MEDGLFTNQGKKLLFVAIFLVLVAALVGGEEDPGMIAQISDQEGTQSAPTASVASASTYSEPEVVVRDPRPVERPSASDTSLEDWYAEAGPSEPVDPQPVDESYLINDTQPAVSAEPQGGDYEF
ncbi:hypothetical protein [Qipengyuania soli]|uniref:Uncharacterized protein n=1 Tax=Qipengyuania soli TaxID=2782568 RepID=A0A7S8ISH9_9SPHN|nr:hypothetical protein [Qipengyuania soli]QPC98523.1 hypothetical protein IRL76_11835 [Qipengyuania soli]